MRSLYKFCYLLLLSSNCYAASGAEPLISSQPSLTTNDPVEERAIKEDIIPPNSFAINLFKPTYILPFYFTGSPYNKVYAGETPDDEQLKHTEFKYQFSFKVPVWKEIYKTKTNLYFAYTQLSYWQLYNKKAFFRETDYEPEIFISHELDHTLFKDFKITFIDLGATHQSNGFGNQLERSWNRIYLNFVFSMNNWMIDVKPWYVIKDNTMKTYNSDITDYLGHEQVICAYKVKDNVLALRTYNLERGNKASAELSLSFPITPYIKGYTQFFTGYGQSLIEYNHRTNSFGIGIALNDYI